MSERSVKILADFTEAKEIIAKGGIVALKRSNGRQIILRGDALFRVLWGDRIVFVPFDSTNWPAMVKIAKSKSIPEAIKKEAIETACEIANNFVLGDTNSYGDKKYVYPNALAFHWNQTPQGYDWWNRIYRTLTGVKGLFDVVNPAKTIVRVNDDVVIQCDVVTTTHDRWGRPVQLELFYGSNPRPTPKGYKFKSADEIPENAVFMDSAGDTHRVLGTNELNVIFKDFTTTLSYLNKKLKYIGTTEELNERL